MAQVRFGNGSTLRATQMVRDAALRMSDAWQALVGRWRPVGVVDEVLRGVSQVMLQTNPLTGLLFLVGVAVTSWPLALAGLWGTVVSTLTAHGLAGARGLIASGLFGFNGFLTGVGLAFFLEPSAAVVAYLTLAAAASTVVMAALSQLLGVWGVPALTAPFVLVVWLFLLAAYQLDVLAAGELLQPGPLDAAPEIATSLGAGVAEPAGATAVNAGDGVLRGVGQVMFQNSALTGAIFLLGLLASSRVSAALAAAGSAAGLAVGWSFGADGAQLLQGIYGFNAALCAIALGGVFVVLSWRAAVYAIAGAVLGAVVTAAMASFLAPVGLPVLTGPFVVATWLLLWAAGHVDAVETVELDDVATPEATWRRRRTEPAATGGER